VFDKIDADNNKAIDRNELKKGLADGVIKKVNPPASPGTPTQAPVNPVTPTQAPVTGDALTQIQKDALVKKHNDLRAGMGASDMLKMEWDDTIAKATQTYVTACPSGHSQNRNNVGENIAWKWASGFSKQSLATTDLTPSVQSWYDEIKDSGPYKTGGTFQGFGQCTGVCGHYTQVVWAKANKLGCGLAYCPHRTGMPGYELVCQYGTSVSGAHGGNMQGSTLFTKGGACASCPSGFTACSQQLCSSGGR
jgi:hypothetical protein